MHVLRVPVSTTVWPGEFIEVDLPGDIPSDCDYALEPRIDSPVQWPIQGGAFGQVKKCKRAPLNDVLRSRKRKFLRYYPPPTESRRLLETTENFCY